VRIGLAINATEYRKIAKNALKVEDRHCHWVQRHISSADNSKYKQFSHHAYSNETILGAK
jgi:hypothetical protein